MGIFTASRTFLVGFVVLASSAYAQIALRKITKDFVDPRESNNQFLAVRDTEDAGWAKLYRSEVAQSRADKICKRYGFDGVDIDPKTNKAQFTVATTNADLEHIWTIKEGTKEVHSADSNRMDVPAPDGAGDGIGQNLRFIGKAAESFFTVGALGHSNWVFKNISCYKMVPVTPSKAEFLNEAPPPASGQH